MRISEHIEHHARRARHHIRERPKVRLLLAIVLTLCLLTATYYGVENSSVRHQDADVPLVCDTLLFRNNVARCTEYLFANYSARDPLERATICEQRQDFPALATLCQEYVDVKSSMLYGAALEEYGVSVWETTEHITGETFRFKSLSAISDIKLVCDDALVDITFTNDTITMPENAQGTCKLIAVTSQGSVTSKTFIIR